MRAPKISSSSARSVRKFAATTLVLGSLGPVSAQPLDAEKIGRHCCPDEEESYATFHHGVDRVLSKLPKKRRESLEPLCQAACCVPEPSRKAFSIKGGFRKVHYLPFYYLGRAYYFHQDYCNALKYFNLSRCRGELEIDEAPRADLEKESKAARRRRKLTPIQFSEGLRAYKDQQWHEVVGKMIEAIEGWDEDGERVKDYARWPPDHNGEIGVQNQAIKPYPETRYFPRYYLAKALFELKCYEESAAVLRCSELSLCEVAGDREKNAARRILEEAERRLDGIEQNEFLEPSACEQWEWVTAELGTCCECVQCSRG